MAAVLVLVLASAESGVSAPGIAPSSPGGLRKTTQTSQTIALNQTTTAKTTGVHRTTRTSSSSTQNAPAGFSPGAIAVLPGLSLREAAWYILVPIVTILAGAMVALLVRKEKPKVFDLKSVVKEMEKQRDYFTSAWSATMRNAALLHYYVLMADACAKMGIADRTEDTPHEFIEKASAELKVEPKDAEQFADVVDRAHYGAELSQEEIASASGFMSSFTQVVIGRAAVV